MQLFREGLVFKAHTFLYHSTLGLRVIKKKMKIRGSEFGNFCLVFGVWYLEFGDAGRRVVGDAELGLDFGGFEVGVRV